MIGQIDIEKSLLNAPNDRSLFVAVASVVNSLVDIVNTIQKEREAEWFEIKEWIGILEAVRKSVNKLETMAKNTNTVLESLVEENNIHEKQIDELQTRSGNVQDPTKWLGKLCKFWDGDEQMSHLCWGILYTITPTSPVPYCCSLGDGVTSDYEHCEPVKPDDDIIYKGE